MNQKDSVKVIEKLVEVCKDGEKGYRDAAEHVKRSDLKDFVHDSELRAWPLRT